MAASMSRMEIRIVLDRREPPGGALLVVPESDAGDHGETGAVAIPFTGWLGLLKALSDVIGADHP
jgi:hypothetical protein